MADADFISDLQNLPDGVVSANSGAIETHRGTDDVSQVARPDAQQPQEVGNEEQPQKPVSLRDQISSALKADATPDAAKIDGGTQKRGADGKFIAAAADAQQQQQEPGAAQTATPVPYPQAGIPGLDAATFATLPAETQQHVARTMEGLNQQAAQYAAYSQIEQVIAPRRNGWALAGVSEGQVINQLFALSDFAEKDPNGFVRYFASQRGLDLEELAFGDDQVDPNVAAQNQRIAELQARLDGMTQQQQQAAHENTVQEIIQFADEKGADGKTLLRPYFAELGNAVLPFIEQALKANPNRPRTDILTEAYDAACWANPTVRAKLLADREAAAEAKRVKDRMEAAQRASKAGVSIPSGAPGEGAELKAGQSTGDLRGDIRAAMSAAT